MNLKAYIIHVKGQEERKRHIESELAKTPFEYEFIEDGNISDLSHERLQKYFDGHMLDVKAASSCGYKHFLAYERIVREKLPMAIIFEDDIELFDNFLPILEQSLAEMANNNLKNMLVSYEYSLTWLINRSEEENNKVLYKKPISRCAGLYIVDFQAATMMLERVKKSKCDTAIDLWHNELIEKGLLNAYWCHPTIAQQQSHNGKTRSLIDNKKYGPVRIQIYKLKMLYKTLRQKLS
ncbi:glycosyltransferase family 25 protein [Arcticibacter sp. MXS-1]|uniref:glycosyltransferase family 25 protein n=1 Tax=Arcticibacter sp. MXS-1 TaxID=3341726 RepID=UPI0035A86DED